MAWLSGIHAKQRGVALHRKPVMPLHMNLLTDIGNIMTGGRLTPQEQLAHGKPLGPINYTGGVQTFAIQERPVSFTGEDYDVYDLSNDRPYCRVKGALLHLPGKDKMAVTMEGSGKKVAVLDRKPIARTPTYDILHGDTGRKWVGLKGKRLP